jgi:hypothetical protein
MKSTKKPKSPLPQVVDVSAVQRGPINAMRAAFDQIAARQFPEAYNEPDDQPILWSMFLAGARECANQIATNAAIPWRDAAHAEFVEVNPPPTPAMPSGGAPIPPGMSIGQ